ncbi:MAG: MlaD family protein [Thiobacillaceae bacterium]|jgi:phospholipid/cholesterol/gamma-HCH transport system substrate-binding protein|nr:MlaD family protein [Thiobacillaceae bacterium]
MERAPVPATLIRNLEFKVGLLLVGTLVLALAFLAYVLHVRGVFEPSQELILVADDAEGVSVGMPLSFSGFPIGRVSRLDLTDQGQVRVHVAVPLKSARWLRESSRFTLEKGLVGGAKIRAFSTNLADPPLPDGAERSLLTGDATQEIPVLVAKVKAILANVEAMTAGDSSINRALAHADTISGRMAGEYGVLEGVLGGPDKARKIVDALDRANSLLANLNGVSLKVDQMLVKADQRVFGAGGTMDRTDQSLAQVNAILADVRESLGKADAILREAQAAAANVNAITADVKGATTDLASLRAEVDESLRKVNHLINEINRKWPFARDVELKLP